VSLDLFVDQVLPLLILVAVAVLVGIWVARARRSGINPFDPRDRRPSGVQEDDDARFDWTAADERGPFRKTR
jgi:hypothetical protein